MKTLFLFLLLAPVAMFAQTKGDNVIIINDTLSAQANFKAIGQHLVKYGYTFKNKDADFYTLQTDLKESNRGYVSFNLNITCFDNKIEIRPKWGRLSGLDSPNSEIQLTEWEYISGKSAWPYKAWETFAPILEAFGPIIYAKK